MTWSALAQFSWKTFPSSITYIGQKLDNLLEQAGIHLLQRLRNALGRELHLLKHVSADIDAFRDLRKHESVPLDRKYSALCDQGRLLSTLGDTFGDRVRDLVDAF